MPAYKLIPITHAALCREAIHKTRAGSLGRYSHVSFASVGKGRFTPLKGANPTIGAIGEAEEVVEERIEIRCESADITREAVRALKEVHPYEEIAYDVVKLEEVEVE